MRDRKKSTLSIEKQLARGPLDLPFLMLTLLLVGIGLIMVFSASYASTYYAEGEPTKYFFRQAGFGLAGIVAMYLISRFDYQRWRGLSIFMLGFALILLVLVLVPGLGVGGEETGAQRWLKLPGLPQFQPSEIAKLAVILFFASRLSKRKETVGRMYNPRTAGGRALNKMNDIGLLELLPYAAILLVIAVLLIREPHMSATILILIVGASILFAAGVRLGWFALAGGVMAAGLTAIIAFTPYMNTRITTWLDPWSDPQDKGLQAIQSLLAIGSGGLTGLGLGNSRQKFQYLPEEHNDFVFAIVCEELGLIGAGLILILFALLIIRGYWLALHARDRFGSLLIVGIVTLLAFQVFLNVAVVTNLIPVTGISLPFFSYGGTALLVQLMEMGIILAVSRQIPAQKSD